MGTDRHMSHSSPTVREGKFCWVFFADLACASMSHGMGQREEYNTVHYTLTPGTGTVTLICLCNVLEDQCDMQELVYQLWLFTLFTQEMLPGPVGLHFVAADISKMIPQIHDMQPALPSSNTNANSQCCSSLLHPLPSPGIHHIIYKFVGSKPSQWFVKDGVDKCKQFSYFLQNSSWTLQMHVTCPII